MCYACLGYCFKNSMENDIYGLFLFINETKNIIKIVLIFKFIQLLSTLEM